MHDQHIQDILEKARVNVDHNKINEISADIKDINNSLKTIIKAQNSFSNRLAILSQHFISLIQSIKGTLRSMETATNDKIRIEDLELTMRSTNALKSEQINTLGDLLTYTEEKLLSIRNLGRKSFLEIKKELKERNLFLAK